MAAFRLLVPGPPLAFRVLRFEGTERLGEPYVFDLTLARSLEGDGEGGLPALPAHAPARLALEGEDGAAVHGILALWEPGPGGGVRARLVPRLWNLSRIRRERGFARGTLPGLLGPLLAEGGVPAGFRLRGDAHPPRDFPGQHGESSLDLLRRWCALEDVLFLLLQEKEGERVVFLEADGLAPAHPGPLSVAGPAGAGALAAWTCRTLAPAPDQPWGPRLLLGEGWVPSLGAGQRFRLQGHPHPAFDRWYRAVEVTQTGGEGIPSRTRFRAVPDEAPLRFRPSPRREGLRRALAGTAPRDVQGRHEVRLPWREPPMDSLRLPLARPFLGEGHGWDFPLEAGGEVLLGFREGDPDRPVILGALAGGSCAGAGPGPDALPGAPGQGGLAWTGTSLVLAAGPERCALGAEGDVTLATPGLARWWTGGDVAGLVHGLRLGATGGASCAATLLSGVRASLGPRFDLFPGASTGAGSVARWVPGRDFRWTGAVRQVVPAGLQMARTGVRNLEVLLRALLGLGGLAAALGKAGAPALALAFAPQAGFLLAFALEALRRGCPDGDADISLLMAPALPCFLGSLADGEANHLALMGGASGPPGATMTFLHGGRRFDATRDGLLQGRSRELDTGWRDLRAILGTRRGALALSGLAPGANGVALLFQAQDPAAAMGTAFSLRSGSDADAFLLASLLPGAAGRLRTGSLVQGRCGGAWPLASAQLDLRHERIGGARIRQSPGLWEAWGPEAVLRLSPLNVQILGPALEGGSRNQGVVSCGGETHWTLARGRLDLHLVSGRLVSARLG